jgi:hypothetical protein
VGPPPVLQRWSTTFPELSDIATLLDDAASLSSSIDERAITSGIWKDDLFVSRTFNGVVHQLLSLERYTEAIKGGTSSPQLVMREAMRCACMILFALLREKFSVHPSGILQHKTGVKKILVKHSVDWSAFLGLRLWVLATASLAVEDYEISWYIDEMRDTAVQMGISKWSDIVEVVRSVLWMEETFKTRNDMLQNLLDLSTLVQIEPSLEEEGCIYSRRIIPSFP